VSNKDTPTKATKTRKLRTLPRFLYFAYGANTNVAAMARRCPLAKPYGKMMLRDHRLSFHGVADVQEAKGRTVFGALWWITPQCERSLDAFEGFPTLYVKQYGKVMLADGTEHVVMFYVMKNPGFPAPPYSTYEDTLRTGYNEFNLPAEQIDLAISEGPPVRHVFTDPAELWETA